MDVLRRGRPGVEPGLVVMIVSSRQADLAAA
jgi:hypothetical protein